MGLWHQALLVRGQQIEAWDETKRVRLVVREDVMGWVVEAVKDTGKVVSNAMALATQLGLRKW